MQLLHRSYQMRIIRLKEVLAKTSLGKTYIYKLIKIKKFPESIALGERTVGWLESEIDSWIQSRILQRDKKSGNTNYPE